MKVFYAWQSDRDEKFNRYFIRDALKLAIKPLAKLPSIEEAPELDHDTKDVPGSPQIAETICEKIRECGVFIADLSFVAQVENLGNGKPTKLIPNPNVLIELGLAASAIGWERIVLVMNTAFGSAEQLPFDLRHRRHPIQYSLTSKLEADAVKLDLADTLRTAIRAVIESGATKPKEAVDLRCTPALVGSGGNMEKVLSIQVTNAGQNPVVISGFGFFTSDDTNSVIFPPQCCIGGWPLPKRLLEAEYFSIYVRAGALKDAQAKGALITSVYVTDSFKKIHSATVAAGLIAEMARD